MASPTWINKATRFSAGTLLPLLPRSSWFFYALWTKRPPRPLPAKGAAALPGTRRPRQADAGRFLYGIQKLDSSRLLHIGNRFYAGIEARNHPRCAAWLRASWARDGRCVGESHADSKL